MPGRKDLGYLNCSVANSIEAIGDRWAILILRDAFMGVRRFEEFQNDLGIARNILSDRLDRLVDDGIFTVVPYQDNPPRHEYRLTDKGRDLLDVLLAIMRWGDTWSPPARGEPRRLVHLDCGNTTHIVGTCAACGAELTRSNVKLEPGLDVVARRREAAPSPA